MSKNDNSSRKEKEIKVGYAYFFLYMKIIPFIYNQDTDDLISNTYLIVGKNNNVFVVDPSRDYDGIANFIIKNEYSISGIILTHAHCDHMRGINRLFNKFQAKLYIGADDLDALYENRFNLSSYIDEKPLELDEEIDVIPLLDHQNLMLDDEKIEVIFTPYHTKGSICLYCPSINSLITGDFLFKNSVGRADFLNSCPRKFYDSLAKILFLPDNTKIYPGHGPFSTIGEEKKLNPFIK